MLALAKIADAKRPAAEIVALETRIAKAQWSKVENRDAVKTYNKMSLATSWPSWPPASIGTLYFDAVGAKAAKELIVAQPSYFTAMAEDARQGAAGHLEGLAEVERDPRTTRAC